MNKNLCNNCGGDYEYRNGRWICRACGAYKPEEISNEEVTLLYTAYQKLRQAEFVEAEQDFDDIIEKYPKNPNAYWGRLMAKYGIKYERDFDGRMIPTCYSTSIESILSASDYKKALEYSNGETRAYYQSQAEYVERVRREWVEKASKEKPYDIFICYKDSDYANGIDRTEDSIAAQDLYTFLTDLGYRVFYSHVSLRDKVGEKYEPYIFNALSTARVMIVYGSKPEYITSTWLKNEWTRYRKRIQAGEKSPESLLVACDGFSPSELPLALSSMQCFNASERTFYGDLEKRLKTLLQSKPAEEKPAAPKAGKKLADRYATKDKVDAVVRELDCDPDLAAEALIIHQGDIAKTIKYINNDSVYIKSRWVCSECKTKNTHGVCRNPKCGLTKEESLKVARRREELKLAQEKKLKKSSQKKDKTPIVGIAIAVIAVLIFIFAKVGLPGSGGGGGNGGEPPLVDTSNYISSAEELKAIAGTSLEYKLSGDIDLSGVEWTPIGDFTGVLDGNGYAIKNLTINASESNVGLFSTLSGTVKNLKLENVSVTASGIVENVGGVCGVLNGSLVNVQVSGTVEAKKGTNVGGIVGLFSRQGAYDETVFGELVNNAEVKGMSRVGGVVGSIENLTEYNRGSFTSTVAKLTNNGTVTGTEEYCAGVVGYVRFNDDYNSTATVMIHSLKNTGTVNGALYTAGILGYAFSDNEASAITDCVNNSEINGEAYVGCIAGQTSNVGISSCDNSGSTLNATGYVIVDNVKYAYVGGYAGDAYTITECSNAVPISYTAGGQYVGGIAGSVSKAGSYDMTKLYNEADISGSAYVGGLFGILQNNSDNNNRDCVTNLSQSQNSGAVTGTKDYVGGLIGCVHCEDHYNSSNTIYVIDVANTGTVTGKLYVGGLFGSAYSDHTQSYISDASNASSVTGEAYVGCIAGRTQNISVKNSTNEGSSLNATGYVTVDGVKYAYVGGYVGDCYMITECANAVPINYTAGGQYVGGIAGALQNGNTATLENISNTADISGASYVGGIFGFLNNYSYANNRSHTFSLYSFSNSGNVTGSGDYVGGIFGNGYFVDTYNSKNTLYMADTVNSGNVTGASYVGGLIGFAESDSADSSLTDCSSTGTVTGTSNFGELAGLLENITIK